MDVYGFLNLACSLDNVTVRLFDCRIEDIVWDAGNHDYWNVVTEIGCTDFAYYEVLSYDLYMHDGKVFLELNIETEEEEDDE